MPFETLIGNDPIKETLKRALLKKQVHHAYIFSGIDGIGKSLFAKEMAKELMGAQDRILEENHPDLHVYRSLEKLHAIETIRSLKEEMSFEPFEAKARVFIFHDVERMLPATANALLKTLEEPSENSYLFLLTSREEDLLPTILSRCVKLSFFPLSLQEVSSFLKDKTPTPEKIASLSFGSLGKALSLLEKEDPKNRFFSLLASGSSLNALLASIEDLELSGKELDEFFTSLLLFVRDHYIVHHQLGEPMAFSGYKESFTTPPPSLERAHDLLIEARFAAARNISLKVILERFLLSL